MKIIYPDFYIRVIELIAEDTGKTFSEVKAELESE